MLKEEVFKILFKNKKLPIIVILIIAAFFCFYGLDWGLPTSWAGDEGGMVLIAVRMLDQKTLYPDRFMYPSLTYYLLMIFCLPSYLYLKLSGKLVGLDFNGILEQPTYSYNFFLISRVASALAGILIVWFIYLLAKKIYGSKVGLLAGFLAALHPPLFAHAHWAKCDIFMTLLALISLYFFVKAVINKKISLIYWASFIGGLAISAKYNAALFLLLPFLISFLLVKYNGRIKVKQWLTFLTDKRFYLASFLFLFSFLLTTPYSIIKIKKFVVSILFQLVATKSGFLGFDRPLGFIENPGIILEMTGYIIFGLLLISLIYLIVKNVFKINHLEIILLSAIIPYYLYLGTWHLNRPYYLIVIFPVLVIFIASFLSFIQKKIRFGYILLSIFLLYNFYFAIDQVSAFTNETKILVQDYTRKNISLEAKIEVNYDSGFSQDEGFNISVMGPNFRRLSQWEDFQKSDLFRTLREIYYKVSGEQMGEIKFLSEQVESNIDQFTIDALGNRNPDYIILSSNYYQTYFDYPQAYPILTDYYNNLIKQETDYKIIEKFPKKKFTPFWTNPEIIILERQND